jgi:hypothetical protein
LSIVKLIVQTKPSDRYFDSIGDPPPLLIELPRPHIYSLEAPRGGCKELRLGDYEKTEMAKEAC